MQGSRSAAKWAWGQGQGALGWSRLDCGSLSCLPTPGLACLHISTLKGNIRMMSLLLKSGANIDVQVSLEMW